MEAREIMENRDRMGEQEIMEGQEISLLSAILEAFPGKKQDIRTYSPLTLAYIGDAVYDLVIRTVVVERANRPANVRKCAGKNCTGIDGRFYGGGTGCLSPGKKFKAPYHRQKRQYRRLYAGHRL